MSYNNAIYDISKHIYLSSFSSGKTNGLLRESSGQFILLMLSQWCFLAVTILILRDDNWQLLIGQHKVSVITSNTGSLDD